MSNSDLQSKAAADWGVFRKWLSANPLTGFWFAFAGGAFGAGIARIILHGLGLVS